MEWKFGLRFWLLLKKRFVLFSHLSGPQGKKTGHPGSSWPPCFCWGFFSTYQVFCAREAKYKPGIAFFHAGLRAVGRSAICGSFSLCSHTLPPSTSGQADMVEDRNTPALSWMLTCTLEWGVLSDFNFVVVSISPVDSLRAHAGCGWMGIQGPHRDIGGLLVDRWEGGGPLQAGHSSSASRRVAVDCSYYNIQVDHQLSLSDPFCE